MKYEDITHKIIGCAMKVHSTLGSGFQEVIYQRALAIEFAKQALAFEREMEMKIYYEGTDAIFSSNCFLILRISFAIAMKYHSEY